MTKRLIAAALLAATSLASAATGATIVQQIAMPHVAAAVGADILGLGSPLAQFDPSLGTLQSVTLSLQNQVLYYPNPVQNTNQTTYASYMIAGHFTDLVKVDGIQLAFAYDIVENGTLFPGEFRMAGPGGTKSDEVTLVSGFGALVGTGTITPQSVMTARVTAYSADPGVQLLLAPSAQFFSVGTLTYTYTEPGTPGVPEPASWALMIAGFALAGGMSRRRGTALDGRRLAPSYLHA